MFSRTAAAWIAYIFLEKPPAMRSHSTACNRQTMRFQGLESTPVIRRLIGLSQTAPSPARRQIHAVHNFVVGK
jgi:hypothetical protein